MQRERRCRPARSPSWARPWHEHRLSVCVPPLGTQKQLAGMLRLFQPWNWHCICGSVPPLLLLLLRAALGSPGLLAPRGEPRSRSRPWARGARQERSCTCCSSYCLISAKNPRMFGSEAFCLRWLWRLLDANKKIANRSGD